LALRQPSSYIGLSAGRQTTPSGAAQTAAAVIDDELALTPTSLIARKLIARMLIARWAPLVFTLAMAFGLGACSSLPTFVPDLALRNTPPPQMEGARGPLSAAQSKAVLERLKTGGKPTDIFERHLALEEAIAGSPLTTGNEVRLLEDGPATYQAMIAAIAAAQDHINLETYILEDDEVGQRFAQALIAKQQQGVQVNLIRDSVGTLGTPTEFFARLADSGIRVLEFNPVNPLAARKVWELNQRDHRKLLIVDQQRLCRRLVQPAFAHPSRRTGLA
jgi:cardiolipin synthase A/B